MPPTSETTTPQKGRSARQAAKELQEAPGPLRGPGAVASDIVTMLQLVEGGDRRSGGGEAQKHWSLPKPAVILRPLSMKVPAVVAHAWMCGLSISTLSASSANAFFSPLTGPLVDRDASTPMFGPTKVTSPSRRSRSVTMFVTFTGSV